MLAATEIDPAMLPTLGAGPDPVGPVTAAFAEASGLSPDTVVAIGCGDEMAATLGAGVFEPGEVCDVVGTAEPVCAASAEPREDPTMLVECHPHADPDAWLLENPGFVSGGNLRWWRDQFAPEERRHEAEGSATPTTSSAARPAGSRRAPTASCSSRRCRARWRPSGTAPRAASSTG